MAGAPPQAREVVVPRLDGSPAATFSVAREGDTITATLLDGVAADWSVVLEGVTDVDSDTVEHTDHGVRLRADGHRVVARLR